MSFEATVFMKMRCDDVEYCLKSTRPIQFFFPPELHSHIALEEGIGNCICETINVKQSVIPIREDRSSKQGVVIDVRCVRDNDERMVEKLVHTGRWAWVISSSNVYDSDGKIDPVRTERFRSGLGKQRNGSTHH